MTPHFPEWFQDMTFYPDRDGITLLCQRCGQAISHAAPFEDWESLWDESFAHRRHRCVPLHPLHSGYRYTPETAIDPRSKP